MPLITTTSV